MFNKYSGTGKMTLYDYRFVIIRRLLAEKTVINRQILSPRNVEHLPTKCQVGENGRVMRKKCKYCKKENNLRKDTIYNCTACPGQPGLCLTPCFKKVPQVVDQIVRSLSLYGKQSLMFLCN